MDGANTMSYIATIQTGLPEHPVGQIEDPDAANQIVLLYNAIQRVVMGIDAINRGTGVYDYTASYGDIVSVYNSSGSHVRKASAAAGTVYPALAFCPVFAGVASSTANVIQGIGIITGLSGLVPGSIYYLSDTVSGSYTSTKPVGAGKIVQPIGWAIDAANLFFNPTLAYTQL